MSQAIIQTGSLKPELRLVQAISQFEADLTDDEKTSFKRDKTITPGPNEVMRLTAEIDRAMQQKGSRRCYGPRLTNFLQAVQNFASIGDILIGGAQFLPACGVWTLVRFSLLAVVNSASYIDDMTSLFMEIGRSAPTYESMAALYPHSKNLQANVLEYFILLVKLCHQMVLHFKKSALKQFFKIMHKSLHVDRQSLERCGLAIRNELDIATAKTVVKESQRNSAFRSLHKLDIDQRHSERKQFHRLQLLDACSKYDYRMSWKQFRKIGSTLLLQSDSSNNLAGHYRTWNKSPLPSTLVIAGPLGCGKTILMANIIDTIYLEATKDPNVAYFFCRHDDLDSLTARIIVGSLTRQLIRNLDISMTSDDAAEDSLDIDDLAKMLRTVLPPGFEAHVLIDGLDECTEESVRTTLTFLHDLQLEFNIKLCIAIREDLQGRLKRFAAPLDATMPKDNPDIERYISMELEYVLDNRQLLVHDPEIVLEIKNQLLAKAEGMFLWVHLQLLLLCLEDSDYGIREVLKMLPLPEHLGETYARLLSKHSSRTEVRQKFLALVLAAFRPLTARELQECMSVTPGETAWDATKLIHDVSPILASCSGLCVRDEEDDTIRLVHSSVEKFLQIEENYSRVKVSQHMCQVIATYLHWPVFERSLIQHTEASNSIRMLPAAIALEATGASSGVVKQAIRLHRSRKENKHDILRTLAEQKKTHVPDFSFQFYARTFWLQHILLAQDIGNKVTKLFARLLQQEKITIEPGYNWKDAPVPLILEQNIVRRIFYWAVDKGHIGLVKVLLAPPDFDGNGNKRNERHPLPIAIWNKDVAMLQVLLEHPHLMCIYDSDKCMDHLQRSFVSAWNIFNIALGCKSLGCAETLLPHLRLEESESLLRSRVLFRRALELGEWKVVSFLLNHVPLNMNQRDTKGHTVLHMVVAHGFASVEIIDLLLEKGANVNVQNDIGISILSTAILQCRLPQQGDPVIQAGSDFANIMRVFDIRYQIAEKLILHKDIDLNTKDYKKDFTPLMVAVTHGLHEIVELLCSQESLDINAVDDAGRSAMMIAVAEEQDECLQILKRFEMEKGTDSHPKGNQSHSP